MASTVLKIDGESLNIDNVWQVAHTPIKVEIAPSVREKMLPSRKYVEEFIESGETAYAINTGFGALSSVSIPKDKIRDLQRNIVRSHAVGVGEILSEAQTRAVLLLRANAISRGHCGVRVEVVEKILEFLNARIHPVIPGQGSVGASGDLAPLSHVALALIGEGEVIYQGKRQKTEAALKATGIKPLELQAKEGLSLINGCQVMTAIGLLSAYEARRVNWLTDLAGSMSLEALKGSRDAFDPLVSATRPHPGEAKTARNLLKIMGTESEIGHSHETCARVQDFYSLRCMPQVHGACKDTLRYTIQVLETEANSSTDNPLVFADERKILSCGNFHGEPMAFALDFLCIAMTAMSSISERRIDKMTNVAHSEGLPAFLAPQGGLHSGVMVVQYAAASLVSENKILSHPASVDSIPTSANKEDHVSMGTIASRKLSQIVRNAENVCAMELFCAAQALDFLKPMKPTAGVLKAYNCIREKISFAAEDRAFYVDLNLMREMIQSDEILNTLTAVTGPLEW